jgi:hypothetical protein
MEIEYGYYCEFDYLSIYDGVSTSDTLLRRICGKDQPANVTSTQNTMLLEFVSNGVLEMTGFKATYEFVGKYSNCLSYLDSLKIHLTFRRLWWFFCTCSNFNLWHPRRCRYPCCTCHLLQCSQAHSPLYTGNVPLHNCGFITHSICLQKRREPTEERNPDNPPPYEEGLFPNHDRLMRNCV